MARYKLDVYLPDGSAEQFTVTEWTVYESRGGYLELECGGVIVAYFAPLGWTRIRSHEFVEPENEA